MIDMKQIKENVSSKIRSQSQEDTTTTSTPPVNYNTRTDAKPSVCASIGSTIHIKGDVSGNEDLTIHGHVEGNVNLKGHNVIIGKTGSVEANIEAKHITVEGELRGDMNGDEKVIIRATGNVHGNIIAPRVTLEDGALFKGSIEMEPQKITSVKNSSPKESKSDRISA